MLVHRMKKKRLTWFGHVIRVDCHQEQCHIEGIWNIERQSKRWIDNTKDGIADVELNIRTATDSASDRKKMGDI